MRSGCMTLFGVWMILMKDLTDLEKLYGSWVNMRIEWGGYDNIRRLY